MVYNRFRDSYAREDPDDPYGTTAIIDEDADSYVFGLISQNADHPTPVAHVDDAGVAVNEQEVADGDIYKENFELLGMYPLGFRNAVILQSVMGGSTTTGSGPYTHTLAPAAAVDGVIPDLPSYTIQHERYGSSDPWSTQFLGCKVASLLITCGWKRRFLAARVNWIAKKDDDVDFQMTNTPALPPTANDAPYVFNNMVRTWDVDGTPLALSGLRDMELLISPSFSTESGHTWDSVSGEYNGDYITDLLENPMKVYDFKMIYMPTSSVIYKELKQTGGTKKMEFQWTRSATDYIKLTLTDCYVRRHQLVTRAIGQSDMLEVNMRPRKVEFEIKDLIPGVHYGE